MKHVKSNTKNSMFKDEHLMWKIKALVFFIKRQQTKSNLLHIYDYADIYIQINMYIAMHICIYT